MVECDEDRIFREQCEKFLSVDNIVDIIRDYNCCKRRCLKVMSPNHQRANYEESLLFIVTLRNNLLAKSKEDRAEKIFNILKSMIFLLLSIYFNTF